MKSRHGDGRTQSIRMPCQNSPANKKRAKPERTKQTFDHHEEATDVTSPVCAAAVVAGQFGFSRRITKTSTSCAGHACIFPGSTPSSPDGSRRSSSGGRQPRPLGRGVGRCLYCPAVESAHLRPSSAVGAVRGIDAQERRRNQPERELEH